MAESRKAVNNEGLWTSSAEDTAVFALFRSFKLHRHHFFFALILGLARQFSLKSVSFPLQMPSDQALQTLDWKTVRGVITLFSSRS